MSINKFPARAVVALFTAGALSACVNYKGIGSDKQVRAIEQLDARQSLRAERGEWPTQNWWENFNDPQLNALIAEALANSPALADAAARIASAGAALENAQAGLLPALDSFGRATWQHYTENGMYPPEIGGSFESNGEIGLRASYQLDFWGRNRAIVATARSQQEAAAAEAASTRLLLASNVANTYFRLAQSQSFRRIAGNALKQRERIYALTKERVAAGIDTQVELKQAQSQLAVTRALLAQVDEGIVNTQHALAALLGAGPDRGLSIVADTSASNTATVARAPDDLPAELLGRRPDIVAARWRVEATLHAVDATKAAFYPNVNLAAFAGYSSIGLDKLLRSGSAVYGGGPALTLPLFDGGQLRTALKSDYATYERAVANYDQTLVTALRDVADQLNSYRALEPQMREQRLAQDAAQAALDLAQQRYRAGLSNYLTVLNAETSVFMQQLYGAQLQARELTLRVEMARAFGGGFAQTSSPSENSQAVAHTQAAGESHD